MGGKESKEKPQQQPQQARVQQQRPSSPVMQRQVSQGIGERQNSASATHFASQPQLQQQQQQPQQQLPPQYQQQPQQYTHQLQQQPQPLPQQQLAQQQLPPPVMQNANPPPQRLSREAIIQTAGGWSAPPIGKGGFSTVYQGRFYNRDVAVKVLTIRNQDERAMFDRELAAMLNPKLQHPNIMPLFAYCDANPAFIFPKLKPLSADRLVRLPPDVCVFIAIDVALGMDYMHRNGFVHSDMKPDNVLLDFDANRIITRAYVGDLGCVRPCNVPVQPFGTILFMDPGLNTSVPSLPKPADDVYSLGLTFLCIFTQTFPRGPQDWPVMRQALRSREPKGADIVDRMTHPNPSARPTCGEVVSALKGYQAEVHRRQCGGTGPVPWPQQAFPTRPDGSPVQIPPPPQQQQQQQQPQGTDAV